MMSWYPIALLLKMTGSFNLFILMAYILASWLTYCYVHAITQSRPAALASGICYGMSGFFLGHLRHGDMIHAVLWLPLILLSLEKLRSKPKLFWCAALAFAIGLCALSGHPQIFLYSIVLAAVYAIANARRAAYGLSRYVFFCGAGFLLGIGMTAVVFIPFSQLAGLSERISGSINTSELSIPLFQLPILIFPFLFGGPHHFGTLHSIYPLDYPGIFEEKIIYVGLIPLIAALIAIRAKVRNDFLVRFWLAVSIVIFILILRPSMGFMNHLPIYNRFRAHTRQVFELSFAVSVLAGIGLKTLLEIPRERRVKILRTAFLSVLGIALACIAVGQYILHKAQTEPGAFYAASDLARLIKINQTMLQISWLPWKNPASGIPIIVILLGGLVLYLWCSAPGRFQSAFLILALILDFGSVGWFCEWRLNAPDARKLFKPAVILPYETDLQKSYQRLGPMEGLWENPGLVRPNLSLVWKLSSISGYDPLLLKRYADLSGIQMTGIVAPESLQSQNRSLDLLSLKYLFVKNVPKALLDNPSRWKPKGVVESTAVFENRRALPRAWMTENVQELPSEEILKTIHTGRLPDGSPFLPEKTALVEEEFPSQENRPSGHSSVMIDRIESTEEALSVETDSPRFLVESDIFYPGWRAFIDRSPTPIFRTDYGLRGIFVPAGNHQIEFKFRPVRFYAGLGITLLSTLIALGCLIEESVPDD